MESLKILVQRLRALVSNRAGDREIDGELYFHLEMRKAENLDAGMTEAEASAEARRRFGDVEKVRALCHQLRNDNPFAKGSRVLLYLILVFGAVLWATNSVAEVNMMAQLMIVTGGLCRLLMSIRSLRPGNPASASDLSSDGVIEETLPYMHLQTDSQPFSKPWNRGRQNDMQKNRKQELFTISVGAMLLSSAVVFSVMTITGSSRALAAHYWRGQAIEKFVGKWAATVGDMSDGKNGPAPMPFRDLPRDLLAAEVTLRANGNQLSGSRVIYTYAKGTDGTPVVAEKGEMQLTNIEFDGHVLSGRVTTAEGQILPENWAMKLLGDNEAEILVTSDNASDQPMAVVRVHRTLK